MPTRPDGGIQSLLLGGAASTALGEKDIEGVRATGSRWEYTCPAGLIGNDKPITITVEQWYSADLGVVVAASQHTSTGAVTEYHLHNLVRSEPDTTLFVIPTDYTRHEGQSAVIRATRKE